MSESHSRRQSRAPSRSNSRPHSKSRREEEQRPAEDVEAGSGGTQDAAPAPPEAGFAVEEVNEEYPPEGDTSSQYYSYAAAPDGEVAYDYQDYQGELVAQVRALPLFLLRVACPDTRSRTGVHRYSRFSGGRAGGAGAEDVQVRGGLCGGGARAGERACVARTPATQRRVAQQVRHRVRHVRSRARPPAGAARAPRVLRVREPRHRAARAALLCALLLQDVSQRAERVRLRLLSQPFAQLSRVCRESRTARSALTNH